MEQVLRQTRTVPGIEQGGHKLDPSFVVVKTQLTGTTMLTRWSSLLADLQEVVQADLPPPLNALCASMLVHLASVHEGLRSELKNQGTDLSDVASFIENIGNAYLDISYSINLHQFDFYKEKTAGDAGHVNAARI